MAEDSRPQYGPTIFEPLGKSPEQYRAMLAIANLHGEGVEISNDPAYHAHPVLGIIGHLHNKGRDPHTHRPVVTWDMHNPIPLEI